MYAYHSFENVKSIVVRRCLNGRAPNQRV